MDDNQIQDLINELNDVAKVQLVYSACCAEHLMTQLWSQSNGLIDSGIDYNKNTFNTFRGNLLGDLTSELRSVLRYQFVRNIQKDLLDE